MTAWVEISELTQFDSPDSLSVSPLSREMLFGISEVICTGSVCHSVDYLAFGAVSLSNDKTTSVNQSRQVISSFIKYMYTV